MNIKSAWQSDRCTEAVVLIGFRRLANLLAIARTVSTYKPCCLFVSIDGDGAIQNEQDRIAFHKQLSAVSNPQTRIHLKVESHNVGIAKNLYQGVSKALDGHYGAIVLEDDCIPRPGFMEFMIDCLRTQRNNGEMGMVSGNGYVNYKCAQLFAEKSDYPQTWGWATWSKVWGKFDPELSHVPKAAIVHGVRRTNRNPLIRRHWLRRIEEAKQDRNMWDAQWTAYLWAMNLKSINPSMHLIESQGFDSVATHTLQDSIFTRWVSIPPVTREPLLRKESIEDPFLWDDHRYRIHLRLLRLQNLIDFIKSLGIAVPGKLADKVAYKISLKNCQ